MLEQFRTWIEYKMAWFRLKRLGYCFKHQIPIEEQDAGLPPPPQQPAWRHFVTNVMMKGATPKNPKMLQN